MSPNVEVHRHTAGSPWKYDALDRRQREIAESVRAGGKGVLLLSEVAPVVTWGRRTHETDRKLPEQAFTERGIDLYPVDRGGFATYHGPGQWVLFAVDRLETLVGDSRGVRRAVEGLLAIALQVAQKYEREAAIREGAETGVWCARGKLASVGIHVEGRVVLHGLALNVYPTETSFFGIRPCGLDASPAFLLGPGPGPEAMEKVGNQLIQAAFGCFWRGVGVDA